MIGSPYPYNCYCFSLQITFKNEVGQYDLEVTTFQLAVLFAWNQRPKEKISFENLKLATELPDAELRRTLWVCVNVLYVRFMYEIKPNTVLMQVKLPFNQ